MTPQVTIRYGFPSSGILRLFLKETIRGSSFPAYRASKKKGTRSRRFLTQVCGLSGLESADLVETMDEKTFRDADGQAIRDGSQRPRTVARVTWVLFVWIRDP